MRIDALHDSYGMLELSKNILKLNVFDIMQI